MTEEEQEPWAALARERDRLHKEHHPDYRYSPKRCTCPTCRTNQNGRNSAEQSKKITALLHENSPREDSISSVHAIDEELASHQVGTYQVDVLQAALLHEAILELWSAGDNGSFTSQKVDPVFIEPVLPASAKWTYAMSPVCLLLNFGFVVM